MEGCEFAMVGLRGSSLWRLLLHFLVLDDLVARSGKHDHERESWAPTTPKCRIKSLSVSYFLASKRLFSMCEVSSLTTRKPHCPHSQTTLLHAQTLYLRAEVLLRLK